MNTTQADIDLVLNKFISGEVSHIVAQMGLVGLGLDEQDARARLHEAKLCAEFDAGIEAIKTHELSGRETPVTVADVLAGLQDGIDALTVIYNAERYQPWAKRLPQAIGEISAAIRVLKHTQAPLRLVKNEGDAA